ncbi:DUF1643 domain-containing protein [Mangrovivirga sp. M17]|uniref:DUF1643 domain-containing protein n=1 Tax=Mangrovivirga halotolerans TaxID=2993936 RepID=A0ABT3RWK6_9BACT|nr:DUF1643 domain-containing protein [Mangrovivirga halotolerans]MCX2745540.1 DUF1643 domain-containing protein [Mangrovivirga halotolerans]
MDDQKTEWIYGTNEDDSARFTLGEKGSKILACIGLNPGQARPGDISGTLSFVKRIANFNGFDGWVMYNVYPQRATNPKDIHSQFDKKLISDNLRIVRQNLIDLNIKTVWLAYGDLIESRKLFKPSMLELYKNLEDLNLDWKIISSPTKKGHPRHPLYKPTKSPLYPFDMDNYIQKIL